jgi:hypothetical protein
MQTAGCRPRRVARRAVSAEVTASVAERRPVRDLVEREIEHRPQTVPLREEPEEVDGIIVSANDPGAVHDFDEVVDAATYLRLKLRKAGGREWLAYHGFGYSLTATERQRLKRFQDSLTEEEQHRLRRMLAVWMLSG